MNKNILLIFFVLVSLGCSQQSETSDISEDPFKGFDVKSQSIKNGEPKLTEVIEKKEYGDIQLIGYREKNGAKVGIWEGYMDGVLYSRIDYSWNGVGIPNGYCASYYDNGQVEYVYKMKNGIIEGPKFRFSKDGILLNRQ